MRSYVPLILIITALTSGVLTYYQDDLYTVFMSWTSGEPKIMVKLELSIPYISQIDKCAVVVRRLPSLGRPTVDDYSEEVYKGLHSAGDVIVIKQLHYAIVAKYRVDPRTGEIKVDYYVPVEYLVLVRCADVHGNIYEYARIHQVFPRHLVTRYAVDVELKPKVRLSLEHDSEAYYPNGDYFNGGGGGYEYPGLRCNIFITESGYWGERGECSMWVRGPRIYALEGLRTAFQLYPGTVVYIESYVDSCYLTECEWKQYPVWRNAGKKETPSGVGVKTEYLSGDYVDTVYFWVVYKYEYSCYTDGFAGVTFCYWLLFPSEIEDAQISSARYRGPLPDVPYEKAPHYPPAPPPYARACRFGDLLVSFNVTRVTDIPLQAIEVGIEYKGVRVYVKLYFYQAVRDDIATPPMLIIEDVSGRNYQWYRWWHRDNDESTMEVLFCKC